MFSILKLITKGLMLYRKIEEALDSGIIVIFPLPSQDNEPTQWKAVLIDKTHENNLIIGGTSPVLFKVRACLSP